MAVEQGPAELTSGSDHLITKRRDHSSLRCKVREERTSAGRPLCWTLNARKRTAPNLVSWSRKADTVSHGIPTTMMTCEDWGPYPLMARRIGNLTSINFWIRQNIRLMATISFRESTWREAPAILTTHAKRHWDTYSSTGLVTRTYTDNLGGEWLREILKKLISLKAIVRGRCSYTNAR